MSKWPPGTPIINDDGKIVAYLNRGIKVNGHTYFWTWFSPKDQTQMYRGPEFVDNAHTIPKNEASISECFRIGDFVVLALRQRGGDIDGMFNGELFRRPSAPISHTWRGKLAALDVLSDDLQMCLHDHQISYFKEMFTHYAEHEGEPE